MERVCHRATATALLATAGESRFLGQATDELADALAKLGSIEMMRALIVSELAEIWNVPDTELPLAEIALRAGVEHADILDQHLHALRGLTKKVDALVDEAKDVVTERLQSVHTGIDRLMPQLNADGYWAQSSLG